jgi:hypothetical protein
MTARTLEQLDAIAAVRAEIAATRERVFDESLPPGPERRLDQERLPALTAKLMALEAPPEAAPPPPTPLVDWSVTREEAAARAAAIRERKDFYDPHRRDANGLLVISKESHALLCRELRELDARASGGGGT